jgi:SAM-dependent methyltransferase
MRSRELASVPAGHGARIDLRDQRAFWNSWNARYRDSGAPLPQVNARQAQMAIEWTSSLGRTDLDILEVGCGTGWLCSQLVAFGEVTGTDLSDEILKTAESKYPGIRFIPGDFMQVDLPSESFDVVVSLEVLAHVADQPAFVAKMARHLRPGGLLILATQNRTTLSRWSAIGPPGEGQIRKWVDARELRGLFQPLLEIIELTSIVPVGDRGFLRVVNSSILNRIVSTVIPKASLDAWKERRFLGHTLMVLARKPRAAGGGA